MQAHIDTQNPKRYALDNGSDVKELGAGRGVKLLDYFFTLC